MGEDDDVHQGHYENGNGLEAAEGTLHPVFEPLDVENHEHESDREDEHLGNGSLEASHTSESLETTDGASARDQEEAIYSPVNQDQVETPEDAARSPEPVDPASDLHADYANPEPPYKVSAIATEDEEPKQVAKDDIADIVGLLESTSFTSKHILQGPDEGVANSLPTPGSDKERQRIGEIPDEE